MAIYCRNGMLIFWAVNKRLVLEIRLPVFIWKTNSKNGTRVKNSKINFVKHAWLNKFVGHWKKEAFPRFFYHFLTASQPKPHSSHECH
jgi:hypothetical protein